MNSFSRNGKRWTVNECLQLQREYELLEMCIDDISLKHQRSPRAIMFKLDQEGFADYNNLYNNYFADQLNNSLDFQSVDQIHEQITSSISLENKIQVLEKQVNELTKMLKNHKLSQVFA